jgi:hypothetical protein
VTGAHEDITRFRGVIQGSVPNYHNDCSDSGWRWGTVRALPDDHVVPTAALVHETRLAVCIDCVCITALRD